MYEPGGAEGDFLGGVVDDACGQDERGFAVVNAKEAFDLHGVAGSLAGFETRAEWVGEGGDGDGGRIEPNNFAVPFDGEAGVEDGGVRRFRPGGVPEGVGCGGAGGDVVFDRDGG